ncbi:MAG: universal stress protein [Planctomycetota bacterium]
MRLALNGNPAPEPDTFIVPLDGSETCRAAVPVASVLANAVRGRVLLVAVGNAAPEPLAEAGDTPFVTRVARYLADQGNDVTVESSKDGDITGVARRQIQVKGSWVVAGSHMRSGINRLLLGSHGDQFLRQCRGPLVVVPDPEIADQRTKNSRAESLLPPESPP